MTTQLQKLAERRKVQSTEESIRHIIVMMHRHNITIEDIQNFVEPQQPQRRKTHEESIAEIKQAIEEQQSQDQTERPPKESTRSTTTAKNKWKVT